VLVDDGLRGDGAQASRSDEDRLEVHPGRLGLALLSLSSIAFGAFFLWTLRGEPLLSLGSLWGPLFLALGLTGGYRLLRHRPALVLGPTEILIRWPLATDTLRWDELDHVCVYSHHVGFVPRDLAGFLARRRGFLRFVLGANAFWGFPHLTVGWLDRSPAEIVEVLRKRHGVRVEDRTPRR